MVRQINFLGYSLWIPTDNPAELAARQDITVPETVPETVPGAAPRIALRPLYSPLALAVYCMIPNLFVGTLLYGINLCRREHRLKGRLFITLSSVVLAFSLVSPSLSPSLGSITSTRFQVIFNGLVALSLFSLESPHFQRAKRNGIPTAKWWMPFIFVAAVWGIKQVLL